MARPNPVQLEAFFNETIRLIVSAPSERVQLQLIIDFLNSVRGYEDEFESYLIQLFQKLPDFSNPLLYAGLDPHLFEEVVHQLEKCVQGNEQFEQSDELELKIFSYKKVLAQLYKWVGEYNQAEVLEEALVVSEKGRQKESSGGVLVPVVEQTGGIKSGRLRRLKVEVIGRSKTQFELKPTFGVIGAEAGSFLAAAEQAAGAFLVESRNKKNKNWRGTAVFELSHAWHAGRSANLALAGAFYCEMLKAEELSEYFRLNPAICITGDVENTGKVLAVEESTLQQKTEAAFFSWSHVLVVPADQLLVTLKIVNDLKSKFPNCELSVVGLTHLRELFFDRRLTLYHKTGAISHNLKKAWKRKFSVVGVSLVLVLLVIIGRLVYGPVDRNPTHVTYSGEYAEIRNKSGIILDEIYVGENLVTKTAGLNSSERSDHIKFVDVNGDGINEILENKTSSSDQDGNTGSEFIIWTLDNDTLFNEKLVFNLQFDNHPYLTEDKFRMRRFKLFDIDDDGIDELVTLLQEKSYFSSMLAVFEIESGELTNTYIHAGYLRDVVFKDLDEDGFFEVLLLAEIKGYNSNGLIILDERYIDGGGILGERYEKSDVNDAIEKAAILIPNTVLGKKLYELESIDSFHYGLPQYIQDNDGYFISIINDFQSRARNAGLVFQFFDNLNVKSITSMDNYDFEVRQLEEQGVLDIKIDASFLATYKDSLQYWNGNAFQNEPTLNKKYLELVGEDSTFYLNHYFQNEE